MGDEDLPSAHDLSERYRRVLFPLGDGVRAVDEDDVVILLAGVVDLGLAVVSARHDEGWRLWRIEGGDLAVSW